MKSIWGQTMWNYLSWGLTSSLNAAVLCSLTLNCPVAVLIVTTVKVVICVSCWNWKKNIINNEREWTLRNYRIKIGHVSRSQKGSQASEIFIYTHWGMSTCCSYQWCSNKRVKALHECQHELKMYAPHWMDKCLTVHTPWLFLKNFLLQWGKI